MTKSGVKTTFTSPSKQTTFIYTAKTIAIRLYTKILSYGYFLTSSLFCATT